jgi:hypothetical protein
MDEISKEAASIMTASFLSVASTSKMMAWGMGDSQKFIIRTIVP